jgi:O-6-methylguanine DNA methyltransferase
VALKNPQAKSNFYVVRTTIGYLGLVWTAEGLCRLVFPVEKKSEVLRVIRAKHKGAEESVRPPKWLKNLATDLQRDLQVEQTRKRSRDYSSLPLDLRGVPPFHEKIYREALKIPRGQTFSYGDLAKRSGSPKAARAVGQAMAKNPIPIIVPCHRVLASGAKLGGFSAPGGLTSKLRLLGLEGAIPKAREPWKILGKSTDEALRHLVKQDPKLAKVIKKVGPYSFKRRSGTPFEWLIRSIISQQLHRKAADTIQGRVRAIFGGRDPRPEELLRADNSLLAKAGLSRNKLAALKDLARAATEGQIPDRRKMSRMSDEEIIAALVPIRGVGRWTVEMLLMFGLGRADVLAVDDFALKKSAMLLHGLKEMPDRKVFAELGERWRPWRTVACWYLWRALDGE